MDTSSRTLLAGTAAIAGSALLSPLAIAELNAPTNEVVVVTIENDVFTGSDNQYTNGVSLAWSSDHLGKYSENDFPRQWANLFSFAPGFDPDENENLIGISLIHEMNTPSDITIENPAPDEQPYSGVLLLGTSLYTDHGDWAQAWNIRIGAVGPITQADHIQRTYHKWIGADEPRGWATQLPNEALVNIGYLAGFDWIERETASGLDWRVRPLTNIEVGNYATALGTGVLFEIGSSLEDTLGATSLGQGLSSVIGVGAAPKDTLEWSAHVGVETYAVAHFVPIDGTLFRDSRSSQSDEVFARGSAGVTVRYSKLIASIALNYGGSPFDDTDEDLDYGAISIGWQY